MHTKVAKNIKLAFFLNIIFAIIELLGGLFTHSISIVSDSLHDFADSISIGISYLCERQARKRPDNKYTFGYLRFSLVGALVSSIVLLIGSVVVFTNAIPRIYNPVVVDYNGMIVLAIFGLLINGFASYKTSKAENINEEAINLHLLEDVFGWLAVLIGSLIIKATSWYVIDPILSIIIAIFIVVRAFRHLKEIVEIFLEKIPEDVDIKELKHHLKEEYQEILEFHQIHVWTIDGVNNYLTMHIVLEDNIKHSKIIELKNNIKKDLAKENIDHVTIEIDFASEEAYKK